MKAHTLRDRLRRGFPVTEAIKLKPTQECVKEFIEASDYHDWIGMSINELYKIFWEWCIKHRYTNIPQKQGFSRQLMSHYPMLKVIPIQIDGKSHRVIRERMR